MATFDPYLRQVASYVEGLRDRGRAVREFSARGEPDGLIGELPIRVGPGASAGIILRSDTFAELGSPEAGSCAFPLWTDRPSLIRDGKVTLVGPDIPESAGATLPFGQVLMVGGPELAGSEHAGLEQGQYVSDKIEGYMIRSSPGHLWSRVSKQAAQKGFGFEALGKALMALFKSEIPKVRVMEVLFVTSGKEDLTPLVRIAEQVETIGSQIAREVWLAKGYDVYECTLGWDCKSCSDKPVCDEIREVVKLRKRNAGEGATS